MKMNVIIMLWTAGRGVKENVPRGNGSTTADPALPHAAHKKKAAWRPPSFFRNISEIPRFPRGAYPVSFPAALPFRPAPFPFPAALDAFGPAAGVFFFRPFFAPAFFSSAGRYSRMAISAPSPTR
jgi:hypothetical protein